MGYKQSIKSISTIVLELCLLVVMILGGWQMPPAYAAVSGYSEVLDDLQRDIEFSVDDYPSNTSDYSIKMIQIAESTTKELFIYTYQPSQLTKYLVATQIKMFVGSARQVFGRTNFLKY
ncbi:MAG: hypothetical protein OSJ74_04975 [Clostridia bacterium]|nr:hypothetical protein [Clostridia bacterium]